MLTTIIIFYPAFALGCSIAGLLLVGWFFLSPRRRAVSVALLILLPFSPLLLVRLVLTTLVNLIDDLCHAGPWIKPIRWAASTLAGDNQ